MTKKEKNNINEQDKENMENMQKRIENLLPTKEYLPTSFTIQQVEELKTRISLLEAQLAWQTNKTHPSSVLKSNPNLEINKQTETLDIHKKNTSHKSALESPRGLIGFFSKLMHPPTFDDPGKNRIAILQNIILWSLIFTYFAISIVTPLSDVRTYLGIILPTLAGLGFILFLLKRGQIDLSAWLIFSLLALSVLGSIVIFGYSDTFPLSMVVLIAVSSLVIRRPVHVVFINIGAFLTFAIIMYLQSSTVYLDIMLVSVGIIAALLTTASFTLERTFSEIEANTQEVRQANIELQNVAETLESRTEDIQLASEIGRIITEKAGNVYSLLSEAAELIRVRFNLYYTQVYLTDTAERTIVLRAGTGEVGQQLLNRRHRLLINANSLNGRAVAEKKPMIVVDTSESDAFLPNPLLPNTRSEMVIPLMIGGRVIGSLDMQSERPGSLNEANLVAFEILAGQLAVAIQNAELLADSEEARKQVESNMQHMTSSGWQDFMDGVENKDKFGYTFDQISLTELENLDAVSSENALNVPITVAGTNLGTIQVVGKEEAWNEYEREIVNATAAQFAQHVENLRLFSQAKKYRQEAEQAARRLTREGWVDYLESNKNLGKGFIYSNNKLTPIQDDYDKSNKEVEISKPISVRDEVIGNLVIDTENQPSEETKEIVDFIAKQLGEHIENLRLLEQAEKRRIEAEDLLRELDSQKFALDQHSIVGITDQTGKIIYANDKFVEISKYSRDELIGQDHRIINSGYHSKEFIRDMWVTIANGKVWHGEILNKAKDGALYWVDSTIVPYLNEEGKPHRYIAIRSDITERKQAEIALKESEARYSAVLEQATDGAVLIQDNVIKYVNNAMSDMLGYQPSDMENQPIINFIAPESRSLIVNRIQARLAGKEVPHIYEAKLLRKDGNSVEVELSAGVIEYLGQPADFGFARDITDRKKAQNAITRRAIELSTVANVSTTASTVLDPEKLLQSVVDLTKERFDIYHAHIYLVDDAKKNLLLAAGSGAVGQKMVATGHAIQMNAEVSLVARSARELKAVIVNDARSEAGFLPNPLLPETRSEMAVPMIVGDLVLGVFDVQSNTANHFTDEDANIYTTLAAQVAVALQNARLFTEIEETAERLKEIDKMKSEFLANMSHELRTPLNSVIGYAEILLTGIDGDLDEEKQADVQAIFDNAKHLLSLINDVLDLAKIEAGRLVIKKEKVKITDLVENVKNNSFGMIHTLKKSVETVTEIEPNLPMIFVDPVRISQVLNNLVSNAIKFSEKGTISIRAFQKNEWLTVEVEDEGVGIDQSNLIKIFERFSQVDGSTTRRVEGTGLGLPISYHLIEMHGGSLQVESEIGKGSKFTILLPLSEELETV